jgi:hypothetical protein
VILFSDILTPLAGMNIPFDIVTVRGKGSTSSQGVGGWRSALTRRPALPPPRLGAVVVVPPAAAARPARGAPASGPPSAKRAR